MNDIQKAAAILGSIGGKSGTGKSKARAPGIMKRAAKKGWIQRRLQMPEKFWCNVERRGQSGCWNWTGSLSDKGYGLFSIRKHAEPAHRVAYRLEKGEIPDGILVCHHCDNRKCCNPFHLFLGTDKDNYDDMVAKGRNVVLKGTKHGMAKLDPQKIEEMKRLRASGQTYVDISRQYGVTPPAARYAIKGQTWKCLYA